MRFGAVVALSVVTALAVTWALLIVTLLIARPKGDALLRDAMRILPDTLRLLHRPATDRAIGVGVRVRLWLLFAYLASPIDVRRGADRLTGASARRSVHQDAQT